MSWEDAEREFADDVVAIETLPRTFERTVDRNADRIAQKYKGGIYDRSLVSAGVLDPAAAGEYESITYAEMRDIVRTLAAGFRDIGVDSVKVVKTRSRGDLEIIFFYIILVSGVG